MDTQIIFLFCLCDEALKSTGHYDDPQCKMFTSEVMTFAITSALFFQCNFARTRLFFQSHKYFKRILSLSMMNRRIHKIPENLWQHLLCLCKLFVHNPLCNEFIIDSFPVFVCQNCRILRCKLFGRKNYHSYSASKKLYFLGIKVHMIISKEGVPIECIFTPGAEADIKALKRMDIDIPAGSVLYGDKAYNDYSLEEQLQEFGIQLVAQRKHNSKKPHCGPIAFLQKMHGKRIETVFSQIIHLMPRSIHAVTAKGFMIKIFLFVLAYSVNTCAVI